MVHMAESISRKACTAFASTRQSQSRSMIFQFMWFMAKNGGFRDLTTSATIAHLTGVKLKRQLPCPRPPLKLQHRFAAIVKSVEQQKTSQRAHLAELDTLFASLQSRAFRGDL